MALTRKDPERDSRLSISVLCSGLIFHLTLNPVKHLYHRWHHIFMGNECWAQWHSNNIPKHISELQPGSNQGLIIIMIMITKVWLGLNRQLLWSFTSPLIKTWLQFYPKKSRTLDFHFFDITKYSFFFYFIRYLALSSEKIIEIGWVVLISWSFVKTESFKFSLHSRDISVRGLWFSDFHTLLPGGLCKQNKERTNGHLYPS